MEISESDHQKGSRDLVADGLNGEKTTSLQLGEKVKSSPDYSAQPFSLPVENISYSLGRHSSPTL